MEKYTKTHTSKKALASHLEKIIERNGQYKIKGNNITYWFPGLGKYDTMQKKINFASKKGSILTFKKPIGINGEWKSQILSKGLKKNRKTGAVKIIGHAYDSPWYKNMNELIEAMDWDQMAKWH
ncbi:MAG: hypothetical protein HYR66_09865 [Sphingobacteriales bacterium]|nr:hypothetical protein [Sphingobacteriales bacterium]